MRNRNWNQREKAINNFVNKHKVATRLRLSNNLRRQRVNNYCEINK